MRMLLTVLLVVATTAPGLAQASIRGVGLSAADAVRVDRQCDVLRFRQSQSLAANPPEEPAAGESVSDPASFWSERADGVDAALAAVDLDTLTIAECRAAGFYD